MATATAQGFCYIHLMGGLGNQMFQIAAAYAHARRTGKQLRIADHIDIGRRRSLYWDSLLQKCAPFVSAGALPSAEWWREPHFHFAPIPLTSGNQALWGYFQSSKYFADVSGEIRALFQSAAATPDSAPAPDKNAWLVHVRRTDYLAGNNRAFHEVCDRAWYERALAVASSCQDQSGHNEKHLYVFSDDLAWCRAPEQRSLWAGATSVTFVDEPDEVRAFRMMQQFRRFIIPNSTFSWWAAWLASSDAAESADSAAETTVIVPNRWFGPKGPQDWEDIYEPDWIRVD